MFSGTQPTVVHVVLDMGVATCSVGHTNVAVLPTTGSVAVK